MSAQTGIPLAWSEERFRETFARCADVHIQSSRFAESEGGSVTFVYVEGLVIGTHLSLVVIPELRRLFREEPGVQRRIELLSGSLPLIRMKDGATTEEIAESIFQGDLLILFDDSASLYRMSMDFRPARQPDESSTEISIKGPRDGFIEDINTNVALLRKRVRSQSLCYETTMIGRRTKTKIGLLYFEDLLDPKVLKTVRSRLGSIDIDGLYSINQLEEMLGDSRHSLLPLMDFTGRPDFALSCLLAGRFVLFVDGNPFALIGPAGLSLILKSPEDVHFNYAYVSFSRIVRAVSLFFSIFLPGIWVALMAFHQDQIPFRMMATISVSRLGLPLSAQMEMFVLLMLLEIFREAGVRLPSNIGQTLASIGGLIIGDAAIRAGLVSPSVVVVGAITAVSGVTLVNQSLSTIISVFRFFFFFMGSFLGIYGLILGIILLAAYMSRLKSFGMPYMAPWSPPNAREMIRSYIRLPWSLMRRRPKAIHPTDPDRQGDDGR
ncbi:spore germination protein [Cohnella xylanilytica]|uniref:Spore germination protein n=1 Tax=Cohnella xylanilytica TaxID=557555 RepID=A0A841U9Z7_9BACL|nr:spore germination protein [Cohnella xylanilytica]MBB6694954.1 spore germination protein [Cohnella xylanilytica]